MGEEDIKYCKFCGALFKDDDTKWWFENPRKVNEGFEEGVCEFCKESVNVILEEGEKFKIKDDNTKLCPRCGFIFSKKEGTSLEYYVVKPYFLNKIYDANDVKEELSKLDKKLCDKCEFDVRYKEQKKLNKK